MQTTRHGLSSDERSAYERDGYLLRRGVFEAADVGRLSDASEELVAELVRHRTGRRAKVGSYTFEPDATKHVMLKWEGDTDVLHGIEPFAHLHPVLRQYADDPRFVDPCRDLVGGEVNLFTEKLNLKRAHHGGVNPLHQDWPYWIGFADDTPHIVTAFLALDACTTQNGCLEVAPGSHHLGPQKGKDTDDAFGRNEMDDSVFDTSGIVPVEMDAGDLLFFGPLLAHRSAPNRSGADRRTFLLSYQPASCRTALEIFLQNGLI